MKIGFVLLSPQDSPMPSTRVAVLNMLPFLRAAGFDPEVLGVEGQPGSSSHSLDPDLLAKQGIRVVCFQKVNGPRTLEAVAQLRARGIRSVFIVCDLVDLDLVEATDATVIVTQFLKEQHPPPLWPKIHVVHDGIERPEVFKRDRRDDGGSHSRPLRAVLVTSANLERLPVLTVPPRWLEVRVVGKYWPYRGAGSRLKEAQWTLRHQPDWRCRTQALRFLMCRRIHRIPWTAEGVYEELLHADIGILPIDTPPNEGATGGLPTWQIKSENRLTLKMSVGLPVIATPIPAYEAVVEQGVNAVLASTQKEWIEALDRLRDPQERLRMGTAARAAVSRRFSMERQASLLIGVLRQVASCGECGAAT